MKGTEPKIKVYVYTNGKSKAESDKKATEIQNSIIMNDCRISSHGQISNCIIGSNNTLGPGFTAEEQKPGGDISQAGYN